MSTMHTCPQKQSASTELVCKLFLIFFIADDVSISDLKEKTCWQCMYESVKIGYVDCVSLLFGDGLPADFLHSSYHNLSSLVKIDSLASSVFSSLC